MLTEIREYSEAMVEGGFGERLATIRKRRGLTQQELADRTGLEQQTISQIERGRSEWPQRRTRDALAAALQVRVEDLTGEEASAPDTGTDPRLSAEEWNLIEAFRAGSEEGRTILLATARAVRGTGSASAPTALAVRPPNRRQTGQARR